MPITRLPPNSNLKSVALTDGLVLMRYLPFPRFLDLVAGNLSFTSMRALRSANDPLECMSIATPDVIMSEVVALPNGGAEGQKEVVDLAPEWIRDRIRDKDTSPRDRSNYFARAFHEYVEQSRAASCWYANHRESAAMWRSFAPDGVAIRTTLKKIEHALPSEIDFESVGVRYLEREFLLIDAVNLGKYRDLILRPYLAKGMEFEHEHEVRIITRCDPGEERISVNMRDFVKTIDQVIVTPLLDTNSTKALRTHLQGILAAKTGDAPPIEVRYSSINSRLLLEAEAEKEFDELAGTLHKRQDGFPL